MVLYVNSCVRKDSRTARLARAVLQHLKEDVVELRIDSEQMNPLDEEAVDFRNQCIEEGRMTDPIFFYAKQFASADLIVMSAPFWDFSFPAMLKVYIENICVPGITFRYNDMGIPQGMCKAKKLIYVSTSGGPFFGDFSYDYIRDLAQKQFGIPETFLVKTENLDLPETDVEKALEDTIQDLDRLFGKPGDTL